MHGAWSRTVHFLQVHAESTLVKFGSVLIIDAMVPQILEQFVREAAASLISSVTRSLSIVLSLFCLKKT